MAKSVDIRRTDRCSRIVDLYNLLMIHSWLPQNSDTPLWLMVYIAPVVNERAETVLMLLTFRDITALKTPLDDEESNKGKYYHITRSLFIKCVVI